MDDGKFSALMEDLTHKLSGKRELTATQALLLRGLLRGAVDAIDCSMDTGEFKES